MLKWAMLCALVALVAGIWGFVGTSAVLAKALFVVGIVCFLVVLGWIALDIGGPPA